MSNTTSSIKKIPLTYKGIFYMNMIEVPAGSFLLGGEKEIVFEKPFYMAEFPVTQEFYEAVMGTNPSRFKGKRRPVEMVSWHDAKAFLEKLSIETKQNYRLPSEAEWEYAARGGNNDNDFEYSGGSILDTLGWYCDNSENQKTRPVGLKMPNELGLFDMSGNVWEWCEDWYDDYSKKPKNGSAFVENGSRRVYRGGSWGNRSGHCRTTYRLNLAPEYSGNFIGFRLCSISQSAG